MYSIMHLCIEKKIRKLQYGYYIQICGQHILYMFIYY